MAISLRRTKDVRSQGVKVLCFGQSGAGKTYMIRTAPNPVVISAESGLLSLHDADIPFVEINGIESFREAYLWASGSDEAKQYETICLDSISEIAEVVLTCERRKTKDPRQAYGIMQEQMEEMIRLFRDLPGRHVYFSAKVEKSEDELGKVRYAPTLPGRRSAQNLPYFFDEVLALRVENDAEGQPQRGVLCRDDGIWLAKDRSGKLDQWELPDLSAIFAKIGGAA